jgi:protein-tyrosine phosphatase
LLRRPELRVLIICTANVCRSPMAEALLRARLAAAGMQRRVEVRSRGTAVAAPGRRADPRVLALLAERGVPLGRTRARQLKAADLTWADRVLVMERRHSEEVAGLDATVRTELLGAFVPAAASEEIADPYFGNRAALEGCLLLLDAALAAFVESLAPGEGER